MVLKPFSLVLNKYGKCMKMAYWKCVGARKMSLKER